MFNFSRKYGFRGGEIGEQTMSLYVSLLGTIIQTAGEVTSSYLSNRQNTDNNLYEELRYMREEVAILRAEKSELMSICSELRQLSNKQADELEALNKEIDELTYELNGETDEEERDGDN